MSITSAGVMGCGTFIIVSVMFFLDGSSLMNLISFPNRLLISIRT